MNRKKSASLWPRRKFSGGPDRGEAATANNALPSDRLVFGMHAAAAALANPERKILAAYLTENAEARLEEALRARGASPVRSLPSELDNLAGAGTVHQGVVLHVSALEQPDLRQFLDSKGDSAAISLVMLDQVTDPHNIGAVVRSAAAFNVDALIVQSRHSPPLSGALAKAASGALEHVPVIEAVNLARTLEELKDRGFRCVGFDSEGETQFQPAVIAGEQRIAFVFGSEDKGLRRLVREGCDAVCALSAPGLIKSLNVSNAAAIVFYESARRLTAQANSAK